jgi:glycosyltransferase involved in cell wall biosynthesis
MSAPAPAPTPAVQDGARSVCLIGPGAPSSNPRLVKEADALAGAGYRVRVVCGTGHSLGARLDDDLLAARGWAVVRVPLGSKWGRIGRVVRHRAAARVVRRGVLHTPALVAWSESELAGRLARAAAAERADLYIGHYLPGLYAARTAARRHGTAYGFDAEDSHVDELPDTPAQASRRAARAAFEGRLLPGAAHLTAASPLIAEGYERRYGRRPLTVLNVFPLADAPPEPVVTPHLRTLGPPRLYWFSQTVGPGRGLESIVAALGRMRLPAELHLLGMPSGGYRAALDARADQSGARGRLIWHPPAGPNEMVRIAAGHDLGLALELTEPPNRAICLTNKAFTYLLAGAPVALSRTPAQERLAADLGAAGVLIDLADPAATAARLDAALGDRGELAARRATAWRLGRERFNWEVERNVFLASVAAALERP